MTKLSLSDKFCIAITTLFGVGFAPFFGGTLASIVAVVIFLAVKSQVCFLSIFIVALILSFLLCSRAELIFQEKDSKKIIIDDFCGMSLPLLFMPHDIRFVAAAFFLFRVFDAFKVPPIDKIERFKGAIGVVGDDLAAGVYSLVMLEIVRLFVK
jgi:phosphatidylglycerophosphatase A